MKTPDQSVRKSWSCIDCMGYSCIFFTCVPSETFVDSIELWSVAKKGLLLKV